MKVKNVTNGLLLVGVAMLIFQMPSAFSQCPFTSGSTGADGDFTPTNSMPTTGWSISNNVVTVTNKSDGIFNFRSINISNAWTVRFTANTLNTPVYLLATGNVVIAGTIDVSGETVTGATAGHGGPGGYGGGNASLKDGWGHGPGFGVDCGSDYNAAFGRTLGLNCDDFGQRRAYGTIDLVPMIGGSGGAATSATYGGGGGGGAILIASSGTITMSGRISADGGTGNNGEGSGGAIKLMANTITGEGVISAVPYNGSGGEGRIRLEACVDQRMSATAPSATFATPGIIILNPTPTITVASIGGQNTPWPPSGSITSTPDMTVTNLPNTATISVAASYISTGTTFNIIINPVSGSNLVASGTLSSGNFTLSSGSVYMPVYTDRVWRVNALIPYIARP